MQWPRLTTSSTITACARTLGAIVQDIESNNKGIVVKEDAILAVQDMCIPAIPSIFQEIPALLRTVLFI